MASRSQYKLQRLSDFAHTKNEDGNFPSLRKKQKTGRAKLLVTG